MLDINEYTLWQCPCAPTPAGSFANTEGPYQCKCNQGFAGDEYLLSRPKEVIFSLYNSLFGKFFAYSTKIVSSRYHTISIVSFLPKILGRDQDFPKGSVWRAVTFQNAWEDIFLLGDF